MSEPGNHLEESSTSQLFDLVIIGGGPTGLFALFYAGMRQMRTLLVESQPFLGGQLTALYPEKEIYDVAGFPRVQAAELVENLVEQARSGHPEAVVRLAERVTGLAASETSRPGRPVWTVRTDQDQYRARAVLICAGIGSFSPKRMDQPGVRELEGRGVEYTVRNKEAYRGQRVLVVGGGDSAVDFALMLAPVASHVTLIHRRGEFRAQEESVERLRESPVEIRLFHELRRVEGEGHVTGAVLFDNRTQEESHLDLDSVVIGTGFAANLGPIRDWGLDLEGNQIKVNTRGETNLPGIYAAGDICTYPGKLRLIATGFGEAATAVNNAKAYLEPGAAAFPGHSSEKMAKAR
ncbi:MAG: NAD(P)/FAD-dependent oxidoreductase [Bacillota bacterium]|nr:NAD(P)/FAD-dependent oxidoreductase [Bacillota bacterium]